MKGKDIIVYGDASFDSSLIREGLIDEFHLFINPVANGMTIFKDLNEIQKFNLVKSITFESGKVGLHYEPYKMELPGLRMQLCIFQVLSAQLTQYHRVVLHL